MKAIPTTVTQSMERTSQTMFPELDYHWTYIKTLWERLRMLREDDRGMTTETVIITAALVIAAGVLIAAIAARVDQESETINP